VKTSRKKLSSSTMSILSMNQLSYGPSYRPVPA
jgi:hypothetical protein